MDHFAKWRRYAAISAFSFASVVSVTQLFTVSSAMAQQTSGNLVGTVKDATGAVVPGSSIVITNEATGVTITLVTNDQGTYRAVNLLAGIYDVQATAPGFQPSLVKGISVQLNSTATQDVSVAVSGSSNTVEVSGEGGVVLDTTSQNLSNTFESRELSTLPVTSIGQGVLNASLLVPGVGSTGGTGLGVGPSIAGQRQRDNNFMIEGIDNNNKSVTGPLVSIPNDAVGEFTLITTQFSPEFGHSAGGQFNTNIISGTNKFHGKLYEYFQNRNLNAAYGTAGNKTPNARFDNNRYGGQLGGPIFKDKLFFFGNFERNTIGQNIQNTQCVPDAAGRATLTAAANIPGFSKTNIAQYLQYLPSPNGTAGQTAANVCGLGSYALTSGPTDANGNQTGTAQGNVTLGVYNTNAPTFSNRDNLTTGMDYTLSPKDSVRGRYIYNTLPAFDTAASLPAFFVSNPTKEHLVALSEFHTFTPNLVNEFRIGFNRYANTTVVGPQTYPGLDSFPNLEFYDTSGAVTSQIGPDPNAPQFTIQNLYQVTDNVTYTKGRQTLTFGFDGRKYISPQGFTQRARGDYEYSNTSDFLHDFAPDASAVGERSSGSHTYYGDQTALYGYANDTFRALRTLTLNFGLRYEFTSVPVGERSQNLNAIANAPGLITFGTPQPTYTSLAPRFGIEFAPDSKTSIRAGYGLAYDVLFDNLGTLSFPPEFSVTQDVGSGTAPASGSPNFLANGGLPPGTGSGTTSFPSAAAARSATSAYVPNQVVPYSENYTLTIQRQLGRGLQAEIGYIGNRGIHLPTQVQINNQPEVNSGNYLPTLLNGIAINGQGSGASTLGAIASQAVAAGQGRISAGYLAGVPASTNTAYFKPAYYGAGFNTIITSYEPYSGSNYNGLIASLQGRMSNGLQLQLSYTYSKTMDDATAEVFATSLTPRRPQNPANVNADYSRSALDHTHRLTLEADYDFHAFKGSNWLMRNLVANWTFVPIYTYESPEYATVLNGSNALILPSSDGAYIGRPIVNPNGVKNTVSAVTAITNPSLTGLCAAGVTICPANTIGYSAVNPNAYYIQAGQGTIPTASRNTLAGRPTNNLDFAAFKRFTVRDRESIEFGAQAFNVLNHAQYIPGSVDDAGAYSYTGLSYQTILSGGKPSSNFGRSDLAFGNNPRTMQLSGKFIF